MSLQDTLARLSLTGRASSTSSSSASITSNQTPISSKYRPLPPKGRPLRPSASPINRQPKESQILPAIPQSQKVKKFIKEPSYSTILHYQQLEPKNAEIEQTSSSLYANFGSSF